MEKFMLSRRLEILKEKLRETSDRINTNDERLSELEQIPQVKEYGRLLKDKQDLTNTRDELSRMKEEIEMSLCNHDLFVQLQVDYDNIEGRNYWMCKCISCGKVVESSSKMFSEVLVKPTNQSPINFYNEVTEMYNYLKEKADLSIEEVNQIMLHRYQSTKEKENTKAR
ncbi:MAG TPA: hypothetical protein GX713_02695 [Mollicutes bacterium]|nr:hypothetical protein [Mollicutes bacterium]